MNHTECTILDALFEMCCFTFTLPPLAVLVSAAAGRGPDGTKDSDAAATAADSTRGPAGATFRVARCDAHVRVRPQVSPRLLSLSVSLSLCLSVSRS